MTDSGSEEPSLSISDNLSEKQEVEKSESEESAPIEFLKKKKRPARHANDAQDEESENIADKMIQSMHEAAQEDIELNKNGQPALSKLKLLERVVKFLKISKYHEVFLEMNGCVVLGLWLAQLPDGSFPSNPLRKGILEAIQDLNIEVENLTNSHLGKNVMAIYKNPAETQQIKKLAKTLIDKWSRKIYGIKTEYTELNADRQYVDPSSLEKKKMNLQNLFEKEGQTNFTRIPEKGLFNFTSLPSSEIKENEGNGQFSAESSFARLKKKMMKKKGNGKNKGKMSVDGKGIDY